MNVSERCPHGVWFDRTGGHVCPETRRYDSLKDARNARRQELRRRIEVATKELAELGADE